MSKTIRVMVVDDHPIVRKGRRLMLATSDDLLLVGDAVDGATALQLKMPGGYACAWHQ